ncbi:hypothetical protein [Microbacterium thalassium]|uniref:Uncharacterized protein n=1 Tax=Microbacterium thalassium TaxID=362649 RepID=A0A7X0KV85_9MICO|nr:hypothetical protein [Microbacterium thalassium]MBB6391923.1 hypothetical protein [Microbacterium thalassium]GLK23943.1 hypothetical protein GCM10017607_12610 [Microbacterium thalassium]
MYTAPNPWETTTHRPVSSVGNGWGAAIVATGPVHRPTQPTSRRSIGLLGLLRRWVDRSAARQLA